MDFLVKQQLPQHQQQQAQLLLQVVPQQLNQPQLQVLRQLQQQSLLQQVVQQHLQAQPEVLPQAQPQPALQPALLNQLQRLDQRVPQQHKAHLHQVLRPVQAQLDQLLLHLQPVQLRPVQAHLQLDQRVPHLQPAVLQLLVVHLQPEVLLRVLQRQRLQQQLVAQRVQQNQQVQVQQSVHQLRQRLDKNMNDFRRFIEFTKKDEDQRIVGGYASSEALDSQGEIVEKDAIARALPGYLGEMDQITGKFRYGNLREMHQLSAVGKTMKARIDDKGLYIEGKVVDKEAWEKVKEGVYAGFSIGGKIVKQVGNRIKDLKLSEISLVDRPANPDAVFAMVKIDDKGKVIDKQESSLTRQGVDMAMPNVSSKPQDYSLMDASHLLDLARDIRMLLNLFQQEGRSTVELATALTALKKLAVKLLTGEDKKKFNKILYGIDFEELNKLTTPQGSAKQNEIQKKDIELYVNTNWTQGYFQDLKKVLG